MSRIEQAWQTRGVLACLLFPISLLLRGLVALRRWGYQFKLLPQKKSSVPVVVVGNLSVGGTGKSPLTAALVEHFQSMDWRPGIVARGYGGSEIDSPQMVTALSDPAAVGDEPVMLAQLTGVPVCVCSDRVAAVAALANTNQVDIVFSDDGLQHYRMARDAEIVVIDEARGFQNGWMLPAGPLREPVSRLKSVDLVALHQTSGACCVDLPATLVAGHFHLAQTELVPVTPDASPTDNLPLSTLAGETVNAVAGIGNPVRFFRQLQLAGMGVVEHPLPDHHEWTVQDLTFDNEHPIVMTSKDAVKVRKLLGQMEVTVPIYEVRVQAMLHAELSQALSIIEDRLHIKYRQPPQGFR